MTHAPQVERIELGELICWRVRTDQAELLVAQQGAQVLRYQRDGEAPLIWLSKEAEYRNGVSIRGGVPVCWPWFGDLARNPKRVRDHYQGAPAPAHGLVRAVDWTLLGVEEVEGGAEITFAAPKDLPDWDGQAELHLRIRLSADLEISLVTRNTGESPLALSQALHTYFPIGDIHQVSIEGLENTRYIETLQDWAECRQQGPVRFTGETDRIYLETPSRLSIVDPALGRRILIDATGSASAIVWNPWIAKAERLSQFANDAWQRMLCIETANVLEDALNLEPGAQARLGFRLSSTPL